VGTLTSGTINGVTAIFGSGGEVTLNSSGITLAAGSGTTNRLKWSNGDAMYGTTGGVYTSGNFTVEDVLVVNGDGGAGIDLSVTDLGVGDSIAFANIAAGTGTTLVWDGSCGCFKKQTSSERYKDNIRPWRPTTAQRLLEATPIVFDYQADRKGYVARDVLGLSAEELHRLAPEAVNLDAQGRPDSINHSALDAYLVQIVKELRAEIDALKERK
jgi:hypothetical protein